MQISNRTVAKRYHLEEQIGSGGMGDVYRAYDRLTGQAVALKRITLSDRHIVLNPDYDTTDFRLAFAQEFKVLSSLRHPNIISVLDYGFDDDRNPFFTLELLENIENIVEYGHQQEFSKQIDLLIEMLQTLTYLHRRGVIHRDLKPDNVMVVNGRVKLLDFGLALVRDATTQQNQGIAGTIAYIAPEVVKGANASEVSDLYSLGMIAYEIFVGHHPFSMKQNLAAILSSSVNEKPDTSMLEDKLALILDMLLEKDPLDRYDNAYDVIEDLCKLDNRPLPKEEGAVRDSILRASSFVGRDLEMMVLKAMLGDVLQGKGSSWLIAGESGVGKSRLLDELRSRALTSGIQVLRSYGVEGGGLPYQLWREPLKRLILTVEVSDNEAAILKEIIPDIERLLGYEIPDIPKLEAKAAHQRMVLTIISIFRRITQPVLLITDDLQWTVESLEVLKFLVNLVDDLPLGIIGSFRDDEKTDLADDFPNATVIKLERLDKQAIKQLSVSMLGHSGESAEVNDLLQRETEGNVFFIIEVLRTLSDEFGSIDDIGRYTLPREIFAGGVEQVIRRRLDRVPSWAKPLLKCAAIDGWRLDEKILKYLVVHREHILPEGKDFEHWLTTCADAVAIEFKQDYWHFSHDKVRKAILDDLEETERPELYILVAEAIEAVYADELEERAQELVDLWHEAGNYEKEINYALIAIQQMFAVSNYHELIRFAQRTLTITENQAIHADILCLLGRSHLRLRELNFAYNSLQLALGFARDINEHPVMYRAIIGLAQAALQSEKPAESAELLGLLSEQEDFNKKQERNSLEPLISATKSALTAQEWHQAYGRGKKLDFDETVEMLLSGSIK